MKWQWNKPEEVNEKKFSFKLKMPSESQHILFLRLHQDYDHNNALHSQEDLQNFFRQDCKNYTILPEVVFRSTDDILNALRRLEDNTLAHISILTHGEMYTIVTGQSSLHMFDPKCTELINILNTKLVEKASVLLCACNTGKILKLDRFPQTQVSENSAMNLFNFQNWCYPNFACMLAFRLLDHPVYCTPNQQQKDELISKFVSPCEEGKIPKIVYVSSRQSMYRYVNSVDDETEIILAKPLELNIMQVDLLFNLRGGGKKFVSDVKTQLRNFERKINRRCLETRRSINVYLKALL